jgi:choline-sulfatase
MADDWAAGRPVRAPDSRQGKTTPAWHSQLSRRAFLASMATAAAAAAVAACDKGALTKEALPTPPRRPNVVLFFPDQEAAVGVPSLNRPNFQRIFDSTVSFSRAYASHPLCCPSRATLFTGLYPHQAGIMYNIGLAGQFGPSLNTALPNLATVFQAAGYDVGHFGKWHLSKVDEVENYGFKPGDYWIPNQEDGKGQDAETAQRAATWIRARTSDRPWFATVSIINPHDILHPKDYTDIPPRDVQLPDNFADAATSSECPEINAYAVATKSLVPANEQGWLQYLRTYYYLIERTDAQLGVVLDALESTGQADDTVFIYTSDHGEMAGSHQLVQKLCLYEESVRIPLHVRYPRLFSGHKESDVLVSNIDILPTLLQLTGVNWPVPLPGLSLRDATIADASGYRDDVFVESNFPEAQSMQLGPTHMLRTKDWKYVAYQSGYEQLFDENADPGEMRNLAGDPGMTSVQQEMKDRLNAWLDGTNARS